MHVKNRKIAENIVLYIGLETGRRVTIQEIVKRVYSRHMSRRTQARVSTRRNLKPWMEAGFVAESIGLRGGEGYELTELGKRFLTTHLS